MICGFRGCPATARRFYRRVFLRGNAGDSAGHKWIVGIGGWSSARTDLGLSILIRATKIVPQAGDVPVLQNRWAGLVSP